MRKLYSLEIKEIKKYFEENEDYIYIYGEIYLNENDLNSNFVKELLKRTQLEYIIKEELIDIINENIDKIALYNLNNNEINDSCYVIHIGRGKRDHIHFSLSLWKNEINMDIIEKIKNAIFNI